MLEERGEVSEKILAAHVLRADNKGIDIGSLRERESQGKILNFTHGGIETSLPGP